MAFTLSKEERLSGKTDIETLMTGGKWTSQPHIRCCCLKSEGEELNRIMVSVPKKHFKRAVKRNLLKRRIRESYRLQKQLLEETHGWNILFHYTSKEIEGFAVIYEEVGKILESVAK